MSRDAELSLEEMVEELRIWSGALPAILGVPARPWNGRELTEAEKSMAYQMYVNAGPQAALEWLSENAK